MAAFRLVAAVRNLETSAKMHRPATRGSLLVVFLTVFIDLLGFGMVLPLLPIYARRFEGVGEHGIVLGLLASSFSLMQFLFAPVWGRVSDRVGRRPILMVGLSGSVVFYTIFGLATSRESLLWMFVSRIGAGIAGATIPTAQAYIADSTTPENRTRGMALIGAAFGLGFTFGPLLAAAALIGSGGEDEAGLSPWPGYVAAMLSAGALALAYFKLPESLRPDTSPRKRTLFDFAALRDAVSIPTIGPLLLTSFVTVLSVANFEGILSFLLKVPVEEGGFGYGFVDVLLYFALLGFAHACAQGLVRGLSGRVSEANLATAGALGSIAGFVLASVATSGGAIVLFLAAMLMVAVGFAFMPAALQSLISRRSDPTRQGAILGVGQSLSALGRIVGHGVCFPLFYLAATLPFVAGAILMGLALLLVTVSARRGRDFLPE